MAQVEHKGPYGRPHTAHEMQPAPQLKTEKPDGEADKKEDVGALSARASYMGRNLGGDTLFGFFYSGRDDGLKDVV